VGVRRNMSRRFPHSLFIDGSLLKSVKRRLKNGIRKFTVKKENIPIPIPIQNYENVKFKSSIDSGLGSDLSSVKEQCLPTDYTESSSPSSILRSVIKSPTFKKKISFFEPTPSEQTRK
jgi:hypothetical protein